MLPWTHAAFGYLLLLAVVLLLGRRFSRAELLAVLVGTQLADVIDKPLAWWFDVVPSGRSLGHSLLFVVPLCAVVVAITWYRRHPEVGVAFGVGYLSATRAATRTPPSTRAAIDTADRLLAGDIAAGPRGRDRRLPSRTGRPQRGDRRAVGDLPEVRRHERRIATRRVLRAEYEAIDGALQRGEVDRDVGERLLGDVERRLDRTRHEPDAAVPSPASSTDWRARLATVGLSLDVGGNADDSVSVDTDADADTDTDTDTDTTGPEDSDRSA
ncbi:metal-dependent hydrolase [Halobaculum lipolyticum]|uniref:metal-dependent hydrolase n=1 Tax=Halobaculum lipolyticum TaxID=3032001 RepID=UPI0024C39956|nr:metal-dependent hydrolase [Halobaculum sp. DT31]